MRQLRVLHVNYSDLDGGAARAAHRIHTALRARGIDSRMLVAVRKQASPDVVQGSQPWRSNWRRALLAASDGLARLQKTPGNPVLHSLNLFASGLGSWINRSDVDLVNLHWLGAETMSVREIAAIRKPVCWTLHDMWAFCGAEHYDDLDYPGRYRDGYRRDNRPPGSSGPDLDAWTWRRKRRAWAHANFRLVGPSRWIADCAGKSALLRGRESCVIPNCLDTDCFRPIEMADARRRLGLQPQKKYILFGAASGTRDRRKGFQLLAEAVAALAASPASARDVEVLLFGAVAASDLAALALPARDMGVVDDDAHLACLYSAADVFAAPSMQDNLANTVVESLACGTPCVAFDVGGMPDLVIPGITGMLARPRCAASFATALSQVLSTPSLRQQCRSYALRQFSMDVVAAKYEALYRDMCDNRRPAG